ncbi:MAG: hypothetical protein ACLFQT_12015 [Thiohalophilus sp.]
MLCLILFGAPLELVAEEQLSREQYVAQSHDDLLAPCQSEAFVSCLDTTEAQCTRQVNQLVETCSEALPDILTADNFNDSAVGYASCVFDGLQEAFARSSEEIGQCENRAGLR